MKIQNGNSIDTVLTVAVPCGGILQLGDIVGACEAGGGIGDFVSLSVHGVFEAPKGTGAGTGFPQCERLYWDNTAKTVVETSNSGANKVIGYAWKLATDADTICWVNLARA